MYLVNRNQFRGYRVSPTVIDTGDLTALETTVSPNTQTTFAYVDVEQDEIFRVGQGVDRGPEYTRGRIHITMDDGSGNEPDDQTDLELCVLSSQNNVSGTFYSNKYGSLKQGASDRTKRVPLPEDGNPVVAYPKRMGLRAEAGGSSSYTVDLGASTVEIDAVRGEK